MAAVLGYQVVYVQNVVLKDVEDHTFWWQNNEVIGTISSVSNSNQLTVAGQDLDREILVSTNIQFVKNGFPLATFPANDVIADTPMTPTTGQQISDAFNLVKDLAQQFVSVAGKITKAVWDDASGFFNTLVNSLKGAWNQQTSDPWASLKGAVFTWLQQSGGVPNLQVAPNTSELTFLLQYSGLTGTTSNSR